jgi:hypothetical protein
LYRTTLFFFDGFLPWVPDWLAASSADKAELTGDSKKINRSAHINGNKRIFIITRFLALHAEAKAQAVVPLVQHLSPESIYFDADGFEISYFLIRRFS